MKNRLQLIIFIVLLLYFLSLTQTQSVAAQSGPASTMFQLVNQFRIDNGLPPFQVNNALVAAAQNQANYMSEFMVFSNHTGYGGSTPLTRAEAAGFYGSVSENIVGGTGMTPRQGLIWWQNSAVHYRTLVTSRYTEAGTGYATNGSENFYVLVVGLPSNRAATASEPVDDSPAPLFVTPIVKAAPREDGSIVHIVQEGQALWSLAAHYEVLLSDLLLYNGLSDNSFLSPGDEIIIRLADGQPPPPTPTPPTTHVVQEGQSLWSIAAVYNLRFADLLWFNQLDEDAVLQPGDELVIRIPEGQPLPPTPTPILYHTVRSGQTLWSIALSYGLTLDDLLNLNNISAEAILQPGDKLLVRRPDPTATPTMSPTPVPEPTATLEITAVSSLPTVTPNQTVAAVLIKTTPTPTISANANALRFNSGSSLFIFIIAVGLIGIGGIFFYIVGRRV
ncbi:MAG: LysM peptidoglycan-binding domain-containing protein [Anaerolineales bacterium]|nr:LysM peptidoglycan-binding domain-containing protein [Anaerolineales bacterium]